MDWFGTSRAVVLMLALFGATGVASAEIYKWTDDAGRVHFTQDLRQVPPSHRTQAETAAKQPARTRIQSYTTPPASPQPGRPAVRSTSGSGTTGKVHKIRVQRAGSSMTVQVLINDRLKVPFHIDTGATDVVLPTWAAEQLGLDLSGARTGVYGTANGTVTQKLVHLKSVSLEGARVEGVPATVSESMEYGLLGLSYFNHFKYDIDPVAGVVTLRRNNLAEAGILRGGRSREQWRQHFAAHHSRIREMKKKRDEVPFSRTRRREHLGEEVQRLEQELKLLESEADDARVPFGWRD